MILIFFIKSGFSQESELSVQTGHTTDIMNVCFSPDGTILASADKINKVILWYVSTGSQMAAFRTQCTISTFIFSPDGNYLLVGCSDGKLILWNVAASKEEKSFQFYSNISSLCYSENKDVVLVAAGSLYEVTLSTGFMKPLANYPVLNIWHHAADNTFFLYTNTGAVRIMDSSGNIKKEFVLYKKKYPPNLVNYSQGGEMATLGWYFRLTYYDLNTQKKKFSVVGTYVDEYFHSIVSSDIYKIIIAANGDGKIYVISYNKGKVIKKLKDHLSDVYCLAMSADNSVFASAGKDRSIIIWDTKTLKPVKRFYTRSFPIKSLAVSKSGNSLAVGNEVGYLKTINLNSSDLDLKFENNHKQAISGIKYFSGDSLIVAGDLNNKITFLRSRDLSVVKTKTFSRSLKPRYVINKFLQLLNFYTSHVVCVDKIDISPDEKNIAVNGRLAYYKNPFAQLFLMQKKKPTVLYDTKKLKKIHKCKDRTLIAKIKRFKMKNPFSILVASKKSNAKKLNEDSLTKNDFNRFFPKLRLEWKSKEGSDYRLYGTEVNTYVTDQNKNVVFSEFGFYRNDTAAYTFDTTCVLYDLKQEKEIATITNKSPIKALNINYALHKIAYGVGNDLVIADMRNLSDTLHTLPTGQAGGRQELILQGHSDKITDIAFHKDNKIVFTSSDDGTVKLWDINKGTLVSTIISIDKDKRIIVTADNYYFTPKGNLSGVGFKIQKQFFSPEQFDLKYNRPDIVLERLGFSSKELVTAYHQAYLKRLKKMNFTEDMFGKDFHLPDITVENKEQIPLAVNTQKLTLSVKAEDSKYKLDRINVFLNNVPVYGFNGIDLRSQKVSLILKTCEVSLLPGKNKIQVSCLNEKGVESLKETFEILCKPEQEIKPDLYIVSIGVSEYADNNFNLTYASKDARDIAAIFKTRQNDYGKVKVLSITDKEATRENILKAKDLLMQSKACDEAVVFYAGHGLLDEKLDYFFATADVDFNNPSQRGLAYDELENLVDGIPALKKLILIDACHSGEVDKEEVELTAIENQVQGEVKFRGFNGLKNKKNAIGLQNSFELMQEIFSDFRKGTGSVVISSASGIEFAYESGSWKNGVFTFSLLEGLKSGKADANGDKKVTVSELKEYITNRVRKLTNGKQNPTSRKENPEFDFKIW
ncbi:MAG: caspase family protein [Bacteroidia bacterium]|nr:caspase family protein [Bacteroidia bacterium]